MRTLAISDVHSKYEALKKLLDGAKYSPGSDRLVLTGDYIDRGEDPVSTLKLLIALKKEGAVLLMGNHESMYLEALEDINEGRDSIENFADDPGGSYNTLKAFYNAGVEADAVELFSSLPMKYMSGKNIFVHAGYNPSVDFSMQSRFTLLWEREQFFRRKMPDGYTVVSGHTPTQWNGFYIWHGANRISIDCGAAYGGRLACLELNDDEGSEGKEYYVECT